MRITKPSSRQFDQDADKAQQAAEATRIADLLAMPGIQSPELVISPSPDLPRPADLSSA